MDATSQLTRSSSAPDISAVADGDYPETSFGDLPVELVAAIAGKVDDNNSVLALRAVSPLCKDGVEGAISNAENDTTPSGETLRKVGRKLAAVEQIENAIETFERVKSSYFFSGPTYEETKEAFWTLHDCGSDEKALEMLNYMSTSDLRDVIEIDVNKLLKGDARTSRDAQAVYRVCDILQQRSFRRKVAIVAGVALAALAVGGVCLFFHYRAEAQAMKEAVNYVKTFSFDDYLRFENAWMEAFLTGDRSDLLPGLSGRAYRKAEDIIFQISDRLYPSEYPEGIDPLTASEVVLDAIDAAEDAVARPLWEGAKQAVLAMYETA